MAIAVGDDTLAPVNIVIELGAIAVFIFLGNQAAVHTIDIFHQPATKWISHIVQQVAICRGFA